MRGVRFYGAPVLALALMVGAAGCGDDDADATSAAESDSPPVGYTPVSEVDEHAAIGQDIAGIKALLDVAKEGEPVDWGGVATLFDEGANSVKGDGSMRTLSTLVEAPDILDVIENAIAGSGPASDVEDAIRAQQVDKGISGLLRAKVLQELDAAADKLADDDTAPESGAPHNVDEAWAFFTAEDSGLASTADKRGADFDLGDEVREAVETALASAQQAAVNGDQDAFDIAAADAEGALNYIFYLATYKYLDTEDDPVRAAEGQTFYLAISDTVDLAAPETHAAILEAFESGNVDDGREALNSDDVTDALGLTSEQLAVE